jgi:hypothetical protein
MATRPGFPHRGPLMRRLAPLIAVVSLAIHVRSAAAAPGEADQRVAQTLFDGARRLMKDGKYAEACPMLEESQRLDPGGGTLLNLAICHEKQGRLATAHAEYSAALSLALASNRTDRQRTAQTALAALGPRLPRLRLIVADPPEGLALSIDGSPLPRAAWTIPMPLDPGPHSIAASAPGRTSATVEATLREGQATEVALPALAVAPRDPPVLLQRVDPAPAPAARECDGFLDRDGVCQHPVVGGLGLTTRPEASESRPPAPLRPQVRQESPGIKRALGVTTVLALTGGLMVGAAALSYKSLAHCDAAAGRCDDQSSLDHAHTARSLAWVSTIATGVSAVSFVGYLLIPDRTVTLDFKVAPQSALLTLGARWP